MRDGDSTDTKSSGSGAGLRRLARVIPGYGGQNDLVQTNLEPMAGGKGVWIGGQVRVMTLGAAVAAFGPGFVSRFDGMGETASRHTKRNSGQINLTSGGQAVKDEICRARETMRAMPAPDHVRFLRKAQGSQMAQFAPSDFFSAGASAADVSRLDKVWNLLLAWEPSDIDYRLTLIWYVTGAGFADIGRKVGISRQAANKKLDRACNALASDFSGTSLAVERRG
jgi:hypothetical protein